MRSVGTFLHVKEMRASQARCGPTAHSRCAKVGPNQQKTGERKNENEQPVLCWCFTKANACKPPLKLKHYWVRTNAAA